jgi:hypothetical protein
LLQIANIPLSSLDGKILLRPQEGEFAKLLDKDPQEIAKILLLHVIKPDSTNLLDKKTLCTLSPNSGLVVNFIKRKIGDAKIQLNEPIDLVTTNQQLFVSIPIEKVLRDASNQDICT